MKSAFITNLLISIFIIFLFTFNVGIKSFLSSIYLQLITPSVVAGQNLYNNFTNFSLALDRSAHLDQALQQVADLSERVVDFEDIKAESKLLKETLGVADFKFKKDELVLGNIVFLDKTNSKAIVIVSEQVNKKIKEGNAVIVSGSIVGIVSQVEKTVVTVNLISNENFVTEAIDIDTKATGLVKGRGYGVLFSDVLNSEKLNLDDIVVTNIVSGKFNRQYVVGKITEVSLNEGEAFQIANIESMINLSKQSKVLIVVTSQWKI